VHEAFDDLDRSLLGLRVAADEWDILYRMRLQLELLVLTGADVRPAVPGDRSVRPGTADDTVRQGAAPAPLSAATKS
jgi:hypothetical protein